MPTSGNGDAPFTSAWFRRDGGIAKAQLLRRKLWPADADNAGRDSWVDWFFGQAAPGQQAPQAELGLDALGVADGEPDGALFWLGEDSLAIADRPPAGELGLDLPGFGDDEPDGVTAFAAADAPAADPLLFFDSGPELDDDHELVVLGGIAFAGLAEDFVEPPSAGDDWLIRFRRRMRR